MAEKTKTYAAKFPDEIIKTAYKEFRKRVGRIKLYSSRWSITNQKDESWQLDSEDDFFVNYQNDLKSAELKYSYFKDSVFYDFSVRYRQGSFETTTTISISLASRTDIELVFSIFDREEEKYKIKVATPLANVENKANKTLYTVERQLIACHVDKKLISDLENYLRRKITFLEDVTSENKWTYNLRITDTYGSESMSSIEQFNLSYFPDDTIRITLSLGAYASNEISLCFSLVKEVSTLKISIKSENSRQIVEGLAAEILQILNIYKTRNGFFHPPTWVDFIVSTLISGLPFIALIFFGRKLYQVGTILILIALMAVIYFIFKKYKPYSAFDSKQNQRREQWSNWLLFSVLEFIIFGVIGSLVVKELFGL